MQVNNVLHKAIIQSKIVPVYYNDNVTEAKAIVTCCANAGLKVFEWVHRGEKAIEHFNVIQNYIAENNIAINLIAGTITTTQQAIAYHSAGAKVLVSPFFVQAVADYCSMVNIGYIPGCFTPTEVFNAKEMGCNWVKIFPASTVGSAYIKAIKAVLPSINIMATGGIKPIKEDIAPWLINGTNAVGMGSELFKEANPVKLQENIASLITSL